MFLANPRRIIYEKLGGAVPDDQKAVYAQRVEEMVPNIRYCAYNIGNSTDIAELVKLRPDAPGLASKLDVSIEQIQKSGNTKLKICTGYCIPHLSLKDYTALFNS